MMRLNRQIPGVVRSIAHSRALSTYGTVLDGSLIKNADYEANKAMMNKKIQEWMDVTKKVHEGGGEKAKAKHKSRGKLLARERIDFLVDAGSPFLELSTLAGHDMYGESVPSGGIVTGVGRVSGVNCVIVANDATVK
eukprot:gene30202-36482_t